MVNSNLSGAKLENNLIKSKFFFFFFCYSPFFNYLRAMKLINNIVLLLILFLLVGCEKELAKEDTPEGSKNTAGITSEQKTNALTISEADKKEKYSFAQENSLIGVEKDPSMYALAYANMRFHGDGKSNLFNCSSLLIDSYAPVDDSGKTYLNETKILLHEALQSFSGIDIAMINPPYSLDTKDNSATREYPIIQKINENEDKLKKLERI